MVVDKTDAVTLVLEFPGNRKVSPAAFLALIFVAGWANSRRDGLSLVKTPSVELNQHVTLLRPQALSHSFVDRASPGEQVKHRSAIFFASECRGRPVEAHFSVDPVEEEACVFSSRSRCCEVEVDGARVAELHRAPRLLDLAT